jgi:hypothetical protein
VTGIDDDDCNGWLMFVVLTRRPLLINPGVVAGGMYRVPITLFAGVAQKD